MAITEAGGPLGLGTPTPEADESGSSSGVFEDQLREALAGAGPIQRHLLQEAEERRRREERRRVAAAGGETLAARRRRSMAEAPGARPAWWAGPGIRASTPTPPEKPHATAAGPRRIQDCMESIAFCGAPTSPSTEENAPRTEEDWQEFWKRNDHFISEKEAFLEVLRQRKADMELVECTFEPRCGDPRASQVRLFSSSRRSGSGGPDLYDRCLEEAQRKEQRLQRLREAQAQKEMEECSFAPTSRRPRVSSNAYALAQSRAQQQGSPAAPHQGSARSTPLQSPSTASCPSPQPTYTAALAARRASAAGASGASSPSPSPMLGGCPGGRGPAALADLRWTATGGERPPARMGAAPGSARGGAGAAALAAVLAARHCGRPSSEEGDSEMEPCRDPGPPPVGPHPFQQRRRLTARRTALGGEACRGEMVRENHCQEDLLRTSSPEEIWCAELLEALSRPPQQPRQAPPTPLSPGSMLAPPTPRSPSHPGSPLRPPWPQSPHRPQSPQRPSTTTPLGALGRGLQARLMLRAPELQEAPPADPDEAVELLPQVGLRPESPQESPPPEETRQPAREPRQPAREPPPPVPEHPHEQPQQERVEDAPEGPAAQEPAPESSHEAAPQPELQDERPPPTQECQARQRPSEQEWWERVQVLEAGPSSSRLTVEQPATMFKKAQPSVALAIERLGDLLDGVVAA